MDESTRIIRFNIEGRWSAENMRLLLAHLEDLYNLRLVIQVLYENRYEIRDYEEFLYHRLPPKRARFTLFYGRLPLRSLGINLDTNELAHVSKLLYPDNQLEIRRINYSSPGLSDIAGLGEIVGHIKDFILRILDMKQSQRQRVLENDERELKNQYQRIENAHRFVQLARECGYTAPELRNMINWVDEKQETFASLIDENKIVSAELLLPEENTNKPE